MKKFFKKIYKKICIKIYGPCYFKGHNFKMEIGWQNNPKFNFDDRHGSINFRDSKGNYMTKKWIYYQCKTCGVFGEKTK